MKQSVVLYENGDHRWLVLARDPERPGYVIDTNEYVVESGGDALMTDPGGMEIFPAVFSAVSQHVDPKRIGRLFASHQDPDIISSLGLWMDFNPDVRCYLSRLWATFVPHFGGDDTTFHLLDDAGEPIQVGSQTLEAMPAHYLHSSGNFHLHDPAAKLLFTGDVGAAMLPPEEDEVFVSDFDRHIRHAEGFHRRWMGSNTAKRDWCERAAKLDLDLLCPQHGAIYQGDDVMRFINWFDELEVGRTWQ